MALGAIGEDDERMRENEKVRGFEKMRESENEGKKEEKEVFVEGKKKIDGEYEEMREMKRMKKKKKWLVTVKKNEKARLHLMAKLCVV